MEENQALPDRPPTPYHIWDGGQWLLPEAVRETARYWAAAEKWEEIKQKRHDNLRGGVYVESVGKWFHSTDEARQQYTFMRTLPMLPPDLMWKTMDGGFVHLCTQSPDPWNYDYSDGWVAVYH